LVLATALIVAVALASAAPLPPSTAPLPGSSFQGADGNQADDSGFADWQQRAAGVVHIPDPEPDSAFVGGSAEDEPGAWDLTTGGVPNKSNFTNVWGAVDQPDGNTFLYLAFTREATTGDTHLAFELNRDDRLWNNGRALIPCRRTGDLVVAYDVGTNAEASVSLQKWITAAADPATGCARSGSFADASDFVANQDVQGSMSPDTIQNFLPGAAATLAGGEFGETSLNLPQMVARAFGDSCLAFSSVWLHSRSSSAGNASLQDYVAPKPLTLRTCAASGTKFFDSNANGVRDAGEPGVPRFLVWADYDNDGTKDHNEPYSVTDKHGDYVIYDIRPPSGTYALREALLIRTRGQLRSAIDWTCSSPFTTAPGGLFLCAWGPIDVNATPNATGRDFGNWYPAQLTVEKQLEPVSDSGRFDLLVNGEVVVPAAGDNSNVTLNLAPGTYDVTEVPVGGTNPDNYTSSVDCRRDVNRRGRVRSGVSYTGLDLAAGQRGSCVFRNVRKGPPPTPAIAIRKTGPAEATAGDTLPYKLYVTNPGEVAFPAAGVHVTDPACDAPPKLDSKLGPLGEPDSIPGTLDPGNPSDTWIYTCSNATSPGGANCQPSVVDNTGAVTGDTGSSTVNDDDSIATDLLCPKQPDPTPEPPIPEPGPGPGPPVPRNRDQPGPVEPPGPVPPDAGDAGIAGVKALAASRRGCLRTHLPRLNLQGTRIASVSVYVNGQFRRRVTLRTLQRQTRPHVKLSPGRHRVSAHVTFQRGSGTPPVTIAASVTICGARSLPPRFTG
jgi:hypothetical protein